MDATKIGRFIGAERRAKGWTQRQLADKLQLTDKAISRWETGKGLPDVSLLLPLANVLDITVGELLAGDAAYSRCHATAEAEARLRVVGRLHAGTWPPIAPPPFLHRIGRISAVCCGVLDAAIFAAGSDRWDGHPWL